MERLSNASFRRALCLVLFLGFFLEPELVPVIRAQDLPKQALQPLTEQPKSGNLVPAPEFIRMDGDKDSVLNEVEFLAGRVEAQVPRWKRDFRVLDLNSDGRLTASEFSLSLALTANSQERGEVPDPVTDWFEKRWTPLLNAFQTADSDKDGIVPIGAWTKSAWLPVLPECDEVNPEHWDRDQDGSITERECRFFLEVAYGLVRPDGLPLRTARGFVVNWPYLRSLDKNADGIWSQEEIVAKYWGGPEKGLAVFQKIDTDGNGQATAQEVWDSQAFYRDVFKQFLEFDKDLDGVISDSELSNSVTKLQQPLALSVLKAFDTDSDGKLNLVEFRSTPIANPLSDWHVARTDRNGDGKLSESEYDVDQIPFLICLSHEFFRRFDLNHDQALSTTELTFTTTAAVSARQFKFRDYDRNADGKLTLEELFVEPLPPPTDKSAVNLHRMRRAYFSANFLSGDGDGNGHLTEDEFNRVVVAFHPAVMTQVLKLDNDGDNLVSRDEYLTPQDPASHASAGRDFHVADGDRDQQLTGIELSRIPNRFLPEDRAPIPDPIVDWMEQQLAILLKSFRELDTDRDGALTVTEWPVSKWSTFVPELHGMKSETWDRNHDGKITEAECRTLLEIADGICREDGLPLRKPTGHVINWPFLRARDLNQDQIWTAEEFIPTFWAGPEKGASVFKEIDLDHNGSLGIQEIWKSPVFFRDIVKLFYDFDKNLDGEIDNQELLTGITGAQQPQFQQTMAFYDLDGDGKLSLYEFRSTPIANIMADWHLPRFDNDLDGKLSEAEFYCEPMPFLLGLSHEYFRRYDVNQDGFINQSELLFFIHYDKVAPEVSFDFKDDNHDGELTVVLSYPLLLIGNTAFPTIREGIV
jgi:Ca2+-binding EF-hand superfamily protein